MAKVKYKSAGRVSYQWNEPANDNLVPRRGGGTGRVLKGPWKKRPRFSPDRQLRKPSNGPARALMRSLNKAEQAAQRAMMQPNASPLARRYPKSLRSAGYTANLPQLGFGIHIAFNRMLWTKLFARMAERVSSSWIDMICGQRDGLDVVGLSAVCGPSGTAYTINRATKADVQWEYATISTLGPPVFPPNLFGWKVNGRAKLKTGAPAMARFPYYPTRVRSVMMPNNLIDVFPWVDPLSLPYGVTMPTPLPNPWGVQLRPSPFRSVNEQSGKRWGRGLEAPSRPAVEGLPTPAPAVAAAPASLPAVATAPGVVAPPTIRDKPPERGVKERKGRVGKAYWYFLSTYGAYTEGVDLVEYVYEALPRDILVKTYRDKGRQPNAAEKFAAVYRHATKIRLGRAIENIVWGNAQDLLFGLYAKPTDKLLQRAVPNFEERMLLRALANHANRNPEDPIADYLRDIIKRARKATRPAFDALDGLQGN